MAMTYISIPYAEVKEILSPYFGDTKRIPFGCVNMTIDDRLIKKIDACWPIAEKDVEDHNGTLQGVMIQEAASQSIVCAVASMNLFPGHNPAFLGSDHFRISAKVYAGDNLLLEITKIRWYGKIGRASVVARKDSVEVAIIDKMLFGAIEQTAGSIKSAA